MHSETRCHCEDVVHLFVKQREVLSSYQCFVVTVRATVNVRVSFIGRNRFMVRTRAAGSRATHLLSHCMLTSSPSLQLRLGRG